MDSAVSLCRPWLGIDHFETLRHTHTHTHTRSQYFVTKQEALAASLGKTPVHWEDVLDNGLNLAANAVIEVWRDGAAMMSSITAGFRTIAAYRPCSPPPPFFLLAAAYGGVLAVVGLPICYT